IALGGHVASHDGVAPFGHPGDFFPRPGRCKAQAQHPDAQGIADLLHLCEVPVYLRTSFMEIVQGGAGELQLAPWLQRDAAAVLGEGNGTSRLFDRRPAEALGQPFQNRANRRLALVGDGLEVLAGEDKLLVLRPDPPVLARLASRNKPLDELFLVGDRRPLGFRRCGHRVTPSSTKGISTAENKLARRASSSKAAGEFRLWARSRLT